MELVEDLERIHQRKKQPRSVRVPQGSNSQNCLRAGIAWMTISSPLKDKHDGLQQPRLGVEPQS